MAENKWNILSTRPLNKTSIESAEAQNVQLDCIEFIQTKAIKTEEIKKQVATLSSEKISVVFTSMNTIEAIKGCLTQTPSWHIYCIGYTTQQLVKEIFGDASIAGTADDASKLADVIIQNKEKELWFFCGDQRREELPNKLRAQQILVEELVVYKTIALPQKIEKNYDGILFYSPSAVHSFFKENNALTQNTFFAIGETTAKAISEYTSNKIITASKPGKEALVQQAIAYFNSKQQPINH